MNHHPGLQNTGSAGSTAPRKCWLKMDLPGNVSEQMDLPRKLKKNPGRIEKYSFSRNLNVDWFIEGYRTFCLQ